MEPTRLGVGQLWHWRRGDVAGGGLLPGERVDRLVLIIDCKSNGEFRTYEVAGHRDMHGLSCHGFMYLNDRFIADNRDEWELVSDAG